MLSDKEQQETAHVNNTMTCYWPNFLHACMSSFEYNNCTVFNVFKGIPFLASGHSCHYLMQSTAGVACNTETTVEDYSDNTTAITPLLVGTERPDQTGDVEEGTPILLVSCILPTNL